MSRRSARPGLVKKPRSAVWHLLLSAFVLIAAAATVLHLQWRNRPLTEPDIAPVEQTEYAPVPAGDARQFADALYQDIDRVLEERGLWPSLIRKRRGDIDRIDVAVPADLPLAEINLAITRAARMHGGHVLRAVETQRDARVEMACGFDSLHTTSIVLTPSTQRRRTGSIALVIDDVSGDSRFYQRFCALPQHLTLALLPNAGPIEIVAEHAVANGHDLLVGLPAALDDDAARDLDDEAVRRALRSALKRVPAAIGFSRYADLRSDGDERILRALLSEAKARNLLFLDGRAVPLAPIGDPSQTTGVRTLQRDALIDEIDARDAIEAKLWSLAETAGRTGSAIGIGRDRQNTLLALEHVLPRLENRGFRFASLEQLAP